MIPSNRCFILILCSGCATPAATNLRTPVTTEVPSRIDHEDPVVAGCVVNAYDAAGLTDRVDGVVSVDRTGLSPRYAVDPALPGLLDCIITSRPELAKRSASFRVSREDGKVTVINVPRIESGDPNPTMPKLFSTAFSSCMLRQTDLRAPAEGAMLMKLEVAASGTVEKITYVAVTAQFDETARECVPGELAKYPIEGLTQPTVINMKHSVRIGDPPD